MTWDHVIKQPVRPNILLKIIKVDKILFSRHCKAGCSQTRGHNLSNLSIMSIKKVHFNYKKTFGLRIAGFHFDFFWVNFGDLYCYNQRMTIKLDSVDISNLINVLQN